MRGNAHADASGAASHAAGQRCGRGHQQRQRPRPELLGQPRAVRRQRTEPRRNLIGIGGDEGKRAVGHPSLHEEHACDGVGVERVGRETVKRVGRQRDEAAGPNPLRRLLEGVPLRRLGVNEHAAHR